MMVSNCKIVCPSCKAINHYDIVKLELVDIDLQATYSCEKCGTIYTDTYALVYMGGKTATQEYDRDNISC